MPGLRCALHLLGLRSLVQGMPWWDTALGDDEDKMNKATSESAPSTQQHWGGICHLARTDLALIPAPTFSEPQLSFPMPWR